MGSSLLPVACGGALVGLGLWWAWTGWSPTRRPLHVALGQLGQRRPAIETSGDDLDSRIGARVRRIGVIDRAVDAMRADLMILPRSPDEQAAILVTAGLMGALVVPVVAAGAWLIGIGVPVVVPLWASLGGPVLGVWLSIRSVRQAAEERRREFRLALSSLCDVTALGLASGAGIESSIEVAANEGTGWPFTAIQQALRTGYMRGETPGVALARLGTDAALPDLTEFAGAIFLAGAEGAAVRATILLKAKNLRDRLTTDAERRAASTTERMGIPATFLLLGFTVFLGYPALAVLFEV